MLNNIFGESIVDAAIERIRYFEPMALRKNPEGYYLCDSGGKDSTVIKELTYVAGVKFSIHHNLTTLDEPRTVYFVYDEKKRWESLGISYTIHRPELNFWQLIRKHKLLPTRIKRFCCAELKEGGGENSMCITGVRWAESVRRSKRAIPETLTSSDKQRIMLFTDNCDDRRQFESCAMKKKLVLNPIIDWKDEDVWAYIHETGAPYNPLYDEGYKRVGCIGCPMSTHAREEWEKHPKYKANLMRTISRMIEDCGGKFGNHTTAEEVYEWWVSGKAMPKDDDEQITMENTDER